MRSQAVLPVFAHPYATAWREDYDQCPTSLRPLTHDLVRTIEWSISHAWSAFIDGNKSAELDVHRALYRSYIDRFRLPWETPIAGLEPVANAARESIEAIWDRSERRRLAVYTGAIPSQSDFVSWVTKLVRAHHSNVRHPLFSFLRDQANYAQLREFVLQETPFDIFFGDILLVMMPGIYGPMKGEFSKNLWDELGHGDATRMHRQLRVDMMDTLQIPRDIYASDIGCFCLEELRLANMYFHGVSNRQNLGQAIGMMLATELMVPGRMEYQIEGFRRVGVDERALRYLIEHVSVDVEHSDGWIEHVVLPLIDEHPETIPEIVLGVARRLDYAGQVCDRMVQYLQAASFSTTPCGHGGIR
jgi:hypothetical protein